ncbi:MAG: pilus assembly protein PilM [Oscillospiraceae bacterium]|nr:pilus assembly protein PilM [Oscillospiraceae bacterium]
MLSFDITDRNIRIIKGTESGNKIRISSAATLELDEDIIVNGYVQDIPRVATLINSVLATNKMADKEAIVSISSNLTIFKELQLEKTREQEFAKNVKLEMQNALGLDDTYSVSYVIVGDTDEETAAGRENLVTVLATACPYKIIECYKSVFQMLGISLKSVMIGCNCITKLLLADTKIKSKMPLLAVQIDRNFISLNLYEKRGKNEDCQLAFSRFASISAEDYDDSDDYVFEAVVENIYRMLQFQRSRNTGETVENVIFYGEIGDNAYYKRLVDEMAKMELRGDTLTAPPQIHGYDNLKFELFANAIGAMFKRNKETEKINLLETDTVNNNRIKSDGTYKYLLLGVTAACAAVVGIAWGVLTGINGGIQSDIDDLQAKINSPETAAQLKLFDNLTTMEAEVESYLTSITNLSDAFDSQPVILGDKYDILDKIVKEVAESLEPKVEKARVVNPQYEGNGMISFSVQCTGVDSPTQKLPADFVKSLLENEKGYFVDVDYSNYSVSEVEEQKQTTDPATGQTTVTGTGKKISTVNFSVTVTMKGEKSIYKPEKADEEKTDTETADTENTEGEAE